MRERERGAENTYAAFTVRALRGRSFFLPILVVSFFFVKRVFCASFFVASPAFSGSFDMQNFGWMVLMMHLAPWENNQRWATKAIRCQVGNFEQVVVVVYKWIN